MCISQTHVRQYLLEQDYHFKFLQPGLAIPRVIKKGLQYVEEKLIFRGKGKTIFIRNVIGDGLELSNNYLVSNCWKVLLTGLASTCAKASADRLLPPPAKLSEPPLHEHCIRCIASHPIHEPGRGPRFQAWVNAVYHLAHSVYILVPRACPWESTATYN